MPVVEVDDPAHSCEICVTRGLQMTGELALLDRKIERTKTLERLGVLENTLMMIGADHG